MKNAAGVDVHPPVSELERLLAEARTALDEMAAEVVRLRVELQQLRSQQRTERVEGVSLG